MHIKFYMLVLAIATTPLALAHATQVDHLLDKDLSRFEIWMGIPHSKVSGLPEGTVQSDNVHDHNGVPMGLDMDVKNVFTVIEENGELVLHITGEIYGGLTTLDSFENYHFSMMHRWGDKKWPPRTEVKRDSGLLYHCQGEHGAFWKAWKASLEYQVQESDLGDFIPLAGPYAYMRSIVLNGKPRFDINGDHYIKARGYYSACAEPDAPHGEWNLLELYVIGGTAIHIANGEIVMVIEDARSHDGKPLTSGQIQIQSEAAECFYKDIKIRPIEAFPEEIANKINWMKPYEHPENK